MYEPNLKLETPYLDTNILVPIFIGDSILSSLATFPQMAISHPELSKLNAFFKNF